MNQRNAKNKTKELSGEEKAWKILENMGWKGKGKKYKSYIWL
jgi:hypothetical protein